MDKNNFIMFCIIFLFGFLSSNLVFYGFLYGFDIPFSDELIFFKEYNKSSPHDIIKEKNIEIFDDKVVIYLDNPSLSKYAPTGSMIPVFDSSSNGVRVKPKTDQDIEVGDIISFRSGNIMIVHRVIEKGEDSEGIYFITKGDNNNITDGKIRFQDIEYITVAVIW